MNFDIQYFSKDTILNRFCVTIDTSRNIFKCVKTGIIVALKYMFHWSVLIDHQCKNNPKNLITKLR